MEPAALLEIGVFVVLLVALSPLVGKVSAWALGASGTRCPEIKEAQDFKNPKSSALHNWSVWRQISWRGMKLGVENTILRWIGSDPQTEMSWWGYLGALMTFQAVGLILLTGLLMLQGVLPGNPQGFSGLPLGVALHTAVSYVTNTNLQTYAGESTLSYLSQMMGLTTQNFCSAATGLAVFMALTRGVQRSETATIGNFWLDVTRSILFFLLPLSVVGAIVLSSQGVIQSLAPSVTATPLTGGMQVIPQGPAASQIAIKLLGSNGGGFFGVNSAHPFENPTPLTNFLELLAVVLIPAALPLSYGHLVGRPHHGRMLFRAMIFLFLLVLIPALVMESSGNPLIGGLPFLEGKEQRFGIGPSVLWAMVTTATANGSVNSSLSSFSPGGGGLALINLMIGEVVFGGVGSGVYGLVLFTIMTVFLTGLMIGRSPEYLGKKIETPEISAAACGLLLPGTCALLFSAIALSCKQGLESRLHGGSLGLTEIIYLFTSSAQNNGSAFSGLQTNTAFYLVLTAIAMLIGRYGVIFAVLFLAGHLASKKKIPPSTGTLETEGWLFTLLLCAIVMIVGVLTYFPALCLGPVLSSLLLAQGKAF